MNKAILIVPLVLLMRPGQNTRGSNMEFCSKNDDTTATSEIVSAPSASSSRADSVSAAKSQNNVRCFAFCLGCPQLIRAQPQIRTVELTHLTDGNINARYAKDHNCNTNTCIPPLVLMIAEE